jgi:methionyl-tRNA synthetase
VIIVANLKPVKLMGVVSQGMVLAARDKDGRLILSTVSDTVQPGSKVA